MITKMRIRCPDKPIRIASDTLTDFNGEGVWIGTAKYDGYRCIQDWDGKKVEFFSRRDINKGGPTIHPISGSLKDEALQWFLENEIPPNTRIDSEWLGRRSEGPEMLCNFGIQYLNDKWIGRELEDVRWTLISMYQYDQPHIMLAENCEDNFDKFFENLQIKDLSEKNWKVEGIVIKHRNSKYLGNIKNCAKNPRWFKAKWRDGASGKDVSASF